MNELTAAYINTNMADLGTAAGLGEEDQITDIQIRLGYEPNWNTGWQKCGLN